MDDPEKPLILLIGDDSLSKTEAKRHLGECRIIEQPYKLETLMESPIRPDPAMVICAEPPDGFSLMEVAQTLRMQYQSCGIFYVSVSRQGFGRKALLKNGFTDAFLLPTDTSVLQEMLKRELSKVSHGQLKHFRMVKLIDIQPGAKLDFDLHIHLPQNKKYIKYSSAGQTLDATRATNLTSHQLSNIHVVSEQMPIFYKYMAHRLKELGSTTKLSETERQEKREGLVRELMSGMFSENVEKNEDSIGKGREIVNDCQEIIKAYVLDSNDGKNNWYKTILMTSGARSDAYSHAVNVSTFAALFSIGLGIGKPEELALAGLLHDIGLTDIPMEIQAKEENERTPEEQAQYQTHPASSDEIIKNRKMIVSELIHKMILQHHERHDGTGFPNGVPGPRICPEAQILAIADYFEELTAAQTQRANLTPPEALAEIEKSSSPTNPSKARFNPALVQKLAALFPKVEVK